jgi:hypothetical protein
VDVRAGYRAVLLAAAGPEGRGSARAGRRAQGQDDAGPLPYPDELGVGQGFLSCVKLLGMRAAGESAGSRNVCEGTRPYLAVLQTSAYEFWARLGMRPFDVVVRAWRWISNDAWHPRFG